MLANNQTKGNTASVANCTPGQTAEGRGAPTAHSTSFRDTLIAEGFDCGIADRLAAVFERSIVVQPRRAFREPGSPRDEAIFVRSGLLAKYKPDCSGGRQIVALRYPGEAILPSEGPAKYGIEAIVRSEVLVGSAEQLRGIANSHAAVIHLARKSLTRHISIGYEWLLRTGRLDAIARVAHLLCETAERSGSICSRGILLNPFTQQQVADITGQTSVNVNRVFSDLQKEGLIRRNGREIHVDDWDELRRRGQFEPAYLR